MNPPLVSVCIPAFNSSPFIVDTLKSVASQTYTNIEIIVIDDGSTDGTFDLISEWLATNNINLKLFRNEKNIGLVKTCNRLLQRASGKYLQLLGGDDLIVESKIFNQVKYLEQADESICTVYSDVAVIDEKGKIIAESYFLEQKHDKNNMPQGFVFPELIKSNFIPIASTLTRMKALKAIGSLDESLCFEDLDMWLRLSMRYKFAYIPCINAKYRRHTSSMMHNPSQKLLVLGSLLDCLEKYRGSSLATDNQINRHIIQLAPVLYRYEHPKGAFWVRRRLNFDKGPRSWVYYLVSLFNSRIIWEMSRKRQN